MSVLYFPTRGHRSVGDDDFQSLAGMCQRRKHGRNEGAAKKAFAYSAKVTRKKGGGIIRRRENNRSSHQPENMVITHIVSSYRADHFYDTAHIFLLSLSLFSPTRKKKI